MAATPATTQELVKGSVTATSSVPTGKEAGGLNNVGNKIQALLNTIRQARPELRKLSHDLVLAKLIEEHTSLQKDKKDLTESVSRGEQTVQSLNASLTEMSKANEETRKVVEEAQKDNAENTTRITALNRDLDNANNQNIVLNRTVQEKSLQLNTKQQAATDLDTKLQNKISELQALDVKSKAELTALKESHQQGISALKENQNKEKMELEKSNKANMDNEINALNEKYKTLTQTKETEHAAEVASLKSSIEALKLEIENYNKSIVSYKAEASKKDTAVSNLNSANQQLRKSLEDVQRQLRIAEENARNNKQSADEAILKYAEAIKNKSKDTLTIAGYIKDKAAFQKEILSMRQAHQTQLLALSGTSNPSAADTSISVPSSSVAVSSTSVPMVTAYQNGLNSSSNPIGTSSPAANALTVASSISNK